MNYIHTILLSIFIIIQLNAQSDSIACLKLVELSNNTSMIAGGVATSGVSNSAFKTIHILKDGIKIRAIFANKSNLSDTLELKAGDRIVSRRSSYQPYFGRPLIKEKLDDDQATDNSLGIKEPNQNTLFSVLRNGIPIYSSGEIPNFIFDGKLVVIDGKNTYKISFPAAIHREARMPSMAPRGRDF